MFDGASCACRSPCHRPRPPPRSPPSPSPPPLKVKALAWCTLQLLQASQRSSVNFGTVTPPPPPPAQGCLAQGAAWAQLPALRPAQPAQPASSYNARLSSAGDLLLAYKEAHPKGTFQRGQISVLRFSAGSWGQVGATKVRLPADPDGGSSGEAADESRYLEPWLALAPDDTPYVIMRNSGQANSSNNKGDPRQACDQQWRDQPC